MATSARPAAYVAAVAALFLSGIGVGLPSDSTRAEDSCAGAPGAAAPEGQHWYYRIDRVKQRKCWYLHAIMALPDHAAPQHRAALSEPPASAAAPQLPFPVMPQLRFGPMPQAKNAAPAPQPAADPPSEIASAQPAPHVTMLTVKPVSALVVRTISAAEAATPEQAGEPPTPQFSPNNASMAVDAGAKPASGANPATVHRATDADHNASVPAGTASARTQSADLFFLLAFALGISAALILLCSKMAGRRRAPRLSAHPDDAWRRAVHEEDAPRLAPQIPHGPADLDAPERIEQPPPARASSRTSRPYDRDHAQSDRAGPVLKDIELALRALRQARQSMRQA